MKIEIVGLISLLILVVAMSGCAFNQVQNKTFSNGGITFQYPGTWADNITFNYAQAPSANTTVLGTIGDNTTSVSVTSSNLTDPLMSAFSIETLAQVSKNTFSAGELITTNTSIYNNITFYEQIYTSKDGVTGELYKNYRLIFGKQGDKIYMVLFKTKEADFQKQYQEMKEIQSSLRYT